MGTPQLPTKENFPIAVTHPNEVAPNSVRIQSSGRLHQGAQQQLGVSPSLGLDGYEHAPGAGHCLLKNAACIDPQRVPVAFMGMDG